jgi:hypothetical protein
VIGSGIGLIYRILQEFPIEAEVEIRSVIAGLDVCRRNAFSDGLTKGGHAADQSKRGPRDIERIADGNGVIENFGHLESYRIQ